MFLYGSIKVYESESHIDSEWPVKKKKIFKKEDDYFEQRDYEKSLKKQFENLDNFKDSTQDLFFEAIKKINSNDYQEYKNKIIDENSSQLVFMISAFGDDEIDHNYEFVVKLCVESKGLKIERVDELSHTGTINNKILEKIQEARFIICDLTLSRQNCYYEIGYAHALGKPVIILAKDGTERHFDISNYKWNYWKDYKDLKPKLEKEALPA